MLDNTLEKLGINYQRQYDLLNGVLISDKKKFNKIKKEALSDKEVLEILLSKGISCFFTNPF